MPLDPNIALQVGQPVQPIDPLKAYGQVLTLKNLMDQQRMHGLQLEKAQRDEADVRGLRNAYAVTPDGQIDEQATTRNLVAGGFGPQAVDFRHKTQVDRSAAAKAEREAEKARLDTLGKTIDLTGQVLSALGPNPTHGQAMDAALFLNQQGIKVDLNSIPEDPAKLAQFVQQHAWQTMSAKEQIAERRAAMEPKSEPGRIEADYRRGLLPNGGGGVTSSVGTTLANNPDATLNAPTAQFQAGAGNELYDAAMARAAYGAPPEGFRYVGRTQQLEPIPEVLAEKLKRAEASASTTNVGINAYEKALNTQDAQAVSDARKGAEQAASAASDARAIAQILKGQNGGNWTAMQAALGGWLPGTPYAKVTSVVSLAEGIRARAAPALRVPGSGAMSDFETKQLLGIFPQLLQSDDGRELAARVLERVADRQAIAADIKDEMVRSGTYSVKKFNDAVRAQFGDGLLNPEEKKLMERLQGGKQKPASGVRTYNPATGKIE